MKAWQAACIVSAITFTGMTYQLAMIVQLGGNTPGATTPDATQKVTARAETSTAPALVAAVPDAAPQAAISDKTPSAPSALALSAAVPKTSAEVAAVPGPVLATAPGPAIEATPAAAPGPVLAAKTDIGDVNATGSLDTKSVDLKPVDTKSVDLKPAETKSADSKSVDVKLADLGHPDAAVPDAAQPVPAARDASTDAAIPVTPAKATQDFKYLIYYVWSELPPAEKPAAVVLRSFKDIPVGTPVEEIKRASDAFGLDFNFMKAVAKIESGFDPKQRTGSYYGLFQLSKYEFAKYGSGQLLDPRDNAVAAAYKVITEGILFGWVTHRTPNLSDLYLIHQQGWEGAAEHLSQPDRIAWKSMCATGEGREKGEKWCKRAIWGNTLPAVKDTWKSVDKLTSEAFIGMWRDRVANFMSKYMATATAAAERANQ